MNVMRCVNCTGQCDPILEAYMDKGIDRIIAGEAPEIDDFQAAAGINSLLTGDIAGIQEIASADPESIKEGIKLRDNLEAVGCTVEPSIVVAQLMTHLTRRILAEQMAEEAENAANRAHIDQMLDDYTQKYPDSRLKSPSKEEQMEAERAEFIRSMGWNPEALSFVEKLEVRDHLRAKGFKV